MRHEPKPRRNGFPRNRFFREECFKEGAKYTPDEKQDFLKRFWWPFHNDVEKSVLELDQKDEKKIFIIDYHNTSGDHLLGPDQKFMPAMVISNLYGTTFPQNSLYQLKTEIEKRLPIPVVLNDIYHGGFDIQWFSQISERKKIQSNLYCIQIEYNLDFIHNPLSHGVDLRAKKIMETALNEAIEVVYDSLPSAKEKMK
jgi:N-formylglutamate amidohydrolase